MMVSISLSFLFGAIGIGYFVYGKKQHRPVPLLAGMGLCMFPYFIHNPYAIVTVGALLVAAPWLLSE